MFCYYKIFYYEKNILFLCLLFCQIYKHKNDLNYVGIVVDQMKMEYLYRFFDDFPLTDLKG
jgi:hypothetical protein